MKTLANCTPVEFLKQTNKIRHEAAHLINDTGIKDIFKCKPVLTGTETEEEKKEKINKQTKENLDRILDILMDEYAEETVHLLGGMCFMDAAQVSETDMATFLEPILKLLRNKDVITFFYILDEIGADSYFRLLSSIRLDLLDILGTEYIFQHIFMEYKKEQEYLIYQIYITDTLQAISENVAVKVTGKYMSKRWYDILNPQPEDTRTAEEIIAHIRKRLDDNK